MATMIYIEKAAERDLEAYRGVTFYDGFTFYDTADVAVDLTGWLARFTMWRKNSTPGSAAALALTSTPAAGITLGGVAGTVAIVATAAQTEALDSDQYDYQFEFEDAAGASQVYYAGIFDLKEGIAASAGVGSTAATLRSEIVTAATIVAADGTLADITTKFNTLLANLQGL